MLGLALLLGPSLVFLSCSDTWISILHVLIYQVAIEDVTAKFKNMDF